jgi:hypothetical protein
MKLVALSGLVLLSACGAAEVQSQRLKDGSLSVTCELAMDECIRRVQDECPNQRYRILEGASETRLRDAPPFERAYHTSRLHLECNNDGANVLLSLGSSPAVSAAAPAAKPPTCSAGETRACIGPGACKGGQACLADGKGYGGCDCGPATPAAVPGSTSTEPVTPAPGSSDSQNSPAN